MMCEKSTALRGPVDTLCRCPPTVLFREGRSHAQYPQDSVVQVQPEMIVEIVKEVSLLDTPKHLQSIF
jgi:hypothetical protein